MLTFLKIIIYFLLILFLLIFFYLKFNPTFGASSKNESLKKIKKSQNFNGKIFLNLKSTKVMTKKIG
jgi:hypothetical protein